MKCVCCKNDYLNFQDLMTHYNKKNEELKTHEYFCCGRIFTNKKHFTIHLKKHFPCNQSDNNLTLRNENEEMHISSHSFEDINIESVALHQTLSSNIDMQSIYIKHLVKFLCIPSSTRELCFKFGAESLQMFRKLLTFLFEKHEIEISLLNSDLDSFFTSLGSNEKKLSEHKFFKCLKNLNCLIPFREVLIDKNFTNLAPNLRYEKKTILLIDIKNLLSKIFNNESFSKLFFEYFFSVQTDEEKIVNLIQCSCWKQKISSLSIDTRTVFIPLIVYCDDFEVLNPLGVHAGAYAICAMYLKLGVLPPEFNSKLDFIWPLQFSFSNDNKDFGNDKMFCEVIKSLNCLFTEGIEIKFPSNLLIKFIVVKIIGDNKGVHELFNFVANFSKAHFFCRFCKSSNDQVKIFCEEQKHLLRTENNYKADVEKMDFKTTGIKQNSIFNELKNFHVIVNSCIDPMHDILEGVALVDLSLIIKNFIDSKFFTLNFLNQRIQNFYYGPNALNKPDNITKENLCNNTLKFTAAQSLNFIQNFNLLVGPEVPSKKNNVHWNLYLMLRKITLIAFKFNLNHHEPEYFSKLVQEHHRLKLTIFGRLKYKDHLLTHYEAVMKYSGPLTQFSNLRFEGKHNLFKKSLNASSNHKNLLYTLGVKSQIQLSNLLLNFNFDSENCQQKVLKKKENFVIPCMEILSDSDILLEHVVKFGKKLEANCIFEFYDLMSDRHQLGKIVAIFERDGKILIVYNLLTSVKICETLDCYTFQGESNDYSLCDLNDICLSRLSYIYSTPEYFYVNLSTE